MQWCQFWVQIFFPLHFFPQLRLRHKSLQPHKSNVVCDFYQISSRTDDTGASRSYRWQFNSRLLSLLRWKVAVTTFFSGSCLGHLFKPLPLGLDRWGSERVTRVDREALLWAGDKWSDFTDVSRQPRLPEPGAYKQVTVAAAAAVNTSLALIQMAGPTWPLWKSQFAVSSSALKQLFAKEFTLCMPLEIRKTKLLICNYASNKRGRSKGKKIYRICGRKYSEFTSSKSNNTLFDYLNTL